MRRYWIMNTPTFEEIIHQDIDFIRRCYDSPDNLNCNSCAKSVCVSLVSVADFPSDYGHFKILAFVNSKDNKEHIMVVKGEIGDGVNILTRIHSKCLTGDSLGSKRCDCGPQLHTSMKMIETEGRGILLYHQEEGRGIGLVNKLRAYALQDYGVDTLDANVLLGFKPDQRSYEIPAEMLKKIGVKSVRLLTNNPDKMVLGEYGVKINKRIPLEIPPHEFDAHYLKTKREKFGHYLHV